MRKFILFFVLFSLFAFGTSRAQINKGAWFVGASSALNFTSYSYKSGGSSLSSFNIDGRTGYFFMDNLTAGVTIGYSHVSQGSASVGLTTLGIFGRYYFQGKIFGGIGINTVSASYSSSGSSSSSSSTTIPIEAGYAAFITDNIAVEPSLVWTSGDTDGGNSISSSFAVKVGFSIYLNRGK